MQFKKLDSEAWHESLGGGSVGKECLRIFQASDSGWPFPFLFNSSSARIPIRIHRHLLVQLHVISHL